MRSLRVLVVPAALTAFCCLVAVSGAGGSGSASGAPSFSPGASLPIGVEPSAVAVGDFDGDGSPDLAVANTGRVDPEYPYSGYRSNLRILLNDGAGHFRMAPGSPFKVGDNPSSVAVADFNRDGRLDVAVTSNGLRTLLGDGTGRFSDAPGSPNELGGAPIVAADLNGDRIPDLIGTAGQDGVFRLRALLGDGSGGFTLLPTPPVAVAELASLNVADLNGDGKADLAVADAKTNRISILLGDGTGGFGAARPISAGAKLAGKVVVGDFNGDGEPDLAVPVSDGSRVKVLLGNGSGGFKAGPSTKVTTDELAVADFDRDGKQDLAATTGYEGSAVLLAQGNGRFRPAPLSPFPVLVDRLIGVADFNGDTKMDILAVGGGMPESPLNAPKDVVLFQTSSEPRLVQGRKLSARADATFSTRSIRVLAADDNRAAACTKKVLVVWTAPRRKAKNFTADCYYDLALGGGRVAWTQYFAWPNEPELTIRVYSHRVSGGPLEKLGRALNYAEHNDLTGGWLGQLLGAGSLLAFNHWDVDCLLPPGRDPGGDEGSECTNENPTLRVSTQELHLLGAHSHRVRRGSGFYPLRAVGGGRLAVAPAGAVVVLTANGARVAAVPAVADDPPRGIALSRTRLAVLRTSTLDVYNPASGAKEASYPLGPAAALRLAGVSSKVALLQGRHDLVLVRLRDGKLVSFPLRSAATKHLVDAKLTAAGLFYAYNVPRRARPGRIVFEPTARLLARF